MLLRTLLSFSLIFGFLHSYSQTKKNDSLEFKTYYYEGGAKSSEGYLRDGKPDGYWKSYYRNGNLKAEGNRKGYALDGPWMFYNEQGDKVVEINYEKGQKNGLRKTFRENKVVKEETFVDDVLQGYTQEFDLQGRLTRETPFVDGREKGEGYEYNTEGRIITLLTYKDGVLTKKQGINRKDDQGQKQSLWMEFFPNRRVKIEGTYVNDLKNGYWKYYQPTGNLIRVEKWVMGVLQENAQEVAKVEIRREINPNTGKLSFKGSYRNGKPEGVHREYDDEGNVVASKIYDGGIVLYEGIVDDNGMKQGPWKEYYPTGELKAEGMYKDNLKVSKWVYYYIEGNVEQTGNYIKGMPDGLWVWKYLNGQTWREEEYFQGLEDGSSVEYSDSGTVIARGQYIEGFKDGEWFFELNDHREVGSYFEGERKGKWKYYYLNNEELAFEGSYENGLPTGTHTWYYPDGRVKRRGQFVGGTKDGIWEYYQPDGEEIISIEYEDGQEIKYNGERIRYGRRYDKIIEREKRAEEQRKAMEGS